MYRRWIRISKLSPIRFETNRWFSSLSSIQRKYSRHAFVNFSKPNLWNVKWLVVKTLISKVMKFIIIPYNWKREEFYLLSSFNTWFLITNTFSFPSSYILQCLLWYTICYWLEFRCLHSYMLIFRDQRTRYTFSHSALWVKLEILSTSD